jgi:hypothetical protein
MKYTRSLYAISVAKSKVDTVNTATVYYTKYENKDYDTDLPSTPNWEFVEEKSISKLDRLEQINTIQVLNRHMIIPGEQSAMELKWDKKVAKPVTPRIAIGLTDDVREMNALVLNSLSEIQSASVSTADNRCHVQSDFSTVMNRNYIRGDVLAAQAEMAKEYNEEQALKKELAK